jgi:hypothetical protein
MAGAPTGFLSPQIPPPNTYVVPIGLEFAPGLGISLDGKAILVGHNGAAGKFSIIGHLDDGTMPQRDFKVSRDGKNSEIKSVYDWQNYSLKNHDGVTDFKGETDRESFTAKESPTAPQTKGAFPAKTFATKPSGDSADVKAGYDEGPHYVLTQQGKTTLVNAGDEEMNFSLTKNDDGSFETKGKYLFQNFKFSPDGDSWVVKGYYPQQKYVIKPE